MNGVTDRYGIFWIIGCCVLLLCSFLACPVGQASAEQIVRIGLYENPPKVFSGQDGKPSGIFVEIIQIIAKKEGWKIEFVPGTWQEGLERLKKNEIDLMPDVYLSEERQVTFQFNAVPVVTDWLQIYTKVRTSINSFEDLNGRTVALLAGGVQQTAFPDLIDRFDLKCRILPLPDYKATTNALMNDEATALVASRFYNFSKIKPKEVVATNIVFRPSIALFASTKGQHIDLLTAIDKHLADMKNQPDSEFNKIIAFWLQEHHRTEIPGYVKWIIIVLVGGGLLLFFFNFLLKRQIKSNMAVIESERQKSQLLQEHLAQSQKMEAIGTMAGGVAHDFNNILAAILGYGELALESLPEGNKSHSYLKEMLKAGTRAKELVRQILAFSRQTKQQLVPMKICSVVNETVKLLRSTFPSNIEIRTNIDKDCGHILASPTQIHQILMNLATNAYHAMIREGGLLSISLTQRKNIKQDFDLPMLAKDPFVVLEVADTGIGMDQATLRRAFEPYFTTKEQGAGTGLGLAIVHGLVEELKGKITVQSKVGEGTVFHVYLPLLDKEGEVPESDNVEPTIPLGNEHILLVDDETILVQVGKSMLEKLGYRVSVCTKSSEALAMFQDSANNFDLLITDQTMPGMTGDQLARKVLEIRPGFPIILCTGFSPIISEETARDIGIKGYVDKPFSTRIIANLIRKVLDEGDI